MIKANSRRLFCAGVSNTVYSRGLSKTYENKVTSHICRAVEISCVCTPQVPDIVGLQDKDEDPVDAGNDRVQPEWGGSVTVLSPNSVAVVMMAISWLIERIVGTGDDEE